MSRRLTGLLGLLLAGSGLALLLSAQFDQPSSAELLADNRGQIELAVVSINSARSSSLRNAALTSTIINQLPEHARILILASDREAFSVVSNPWPDRIQFVDMPDDYALTIWPQDPFVVLQGDEGPHLLASPEFARADDREMASLLAQFLDIPLEFSSLSFEGGNIVSDESHVYIGANTILFNAIEKNQSETEIAKQFQLELGKPVVVIGPAPQAIGHIDMMLTPLGEKRLLLADPGWGAELAQQDMDETPQAVAAFEKASEDNFFGLEGITELKMQDGGSITAPDIIGASSHAVADSLAISDTLDRVGQQLEALGFEIHRVPFLFRMQDYDESIAEGETIPARPGYPQLTYNNVLLESDGEQNIVYLPEYGWPNLDNAASEVWRELGYRVEAIPGFTTTSMYGGALRCSVKVLSRN